jgi:hypothetical protein
MRPERLTPALGFVACGARWRGLLLALRRVVTMIRAMLAGPDGLGSSWMPAGVYRVRNWRIAVAISATWVSRAK